MADETKKDVETGEEFFHLIPVTETHAKSKSIPSGDSPKSPKSKKKKNEKKNGKLLYWLYDDQHTVGCVLKKKTDTGKVKFSEPQLFIFENIEDGVNNEIKHLKAEKGESLSLPIGIEHFRSTEKNRYKVLDKLFNGPPDTSTDASDFIEFRKLTLESSSRSERFSVLKVICVILSSYIIRPMLSVPDVLDTYRLDKKELRAFHVNVSKGENAYFNLRQICQAMIVGTSAKEDNWFSLTMPTIISPDTEQPILEFAHLDIDGCKKHHWPAPYRDTSVLLDARSVKTRDMSEFAKRNPWCSCIIYGKKQKDVNAFGYGEDIAGGTLSTSPELNIDAIHSLIKQYVINIPDLFCDESQKFLPIWKQAGVYLEKHMTIHKSVKWKDSVRFKQRVEVTALLSFFNFVQGECVVPEGEMKDFQNSLLDVLLPDCLAEEPTTQASLQSHPPQEVFEEMLQNLLTEENLKHIYALPKKNGVVWPEYTEQNDMIFGYVKWYDWPGEERPVQCLVLIDETLQNAVDKLDLRPAGFKDVLAAIKKERPPYLHSNPIAKVIRTQGEKAKQAPAYRLKISELPIDEGIKQKLLEMAIKE